LRFPSEARILDSGFSPAKPSFADGEPHVIDRHGRLGPLRRANRRATHMRAPARYFTQQKS
jgi:hypothetical protein